MNSYDGVFREFFAFFAEVEEFAAGTALSRKDERDGTVRVSDIISKLA